eukprot:206648-Pleurochrysis_carterae.AAC.1
MASCGAHVMYTLAIKGTLATRQKSMGSLARFIRARCCVMRSELMTRETNCESTTNVQFSFVLTKMCMACPFRKIC